MDKIAPEINGNPIEIENSHPPNGGPRILPNESKEESIPVVLPYPLVVFLVNKAEIAGRITPFPNPKIVKKIAAVQKLEVNRININPIIETSIPALMTAPSPNFFVIFPTNPPCTIALPRPIIIKI